MLKVQLETLSTSCGQVIGHIKNMRLFDVLEFSRQFSKSIPVMFSTDVVTLIKLLVVTPATNASSGRAFSALCHIKTYLRTTMTHTRSNCVTILDVHNNRTGLLELGGAARFYFRK